MSNEKLKLEFDLAAKDGVIEYLKTDIQEAKKLIENLKVQLK